MSKKTEVDQFKSKRRQIMIRGLMQEMIETYGWLMQLEEKGILEDEDIRAYAEGLLELNELLRHRKAMVYMPGRELASIVGRLK